MIGKLTERVADLERQLGQNSGNSAKPQSRDPAAERQRQAEERAKRKQAGKTRRQGKQRGSRGKTLEMSASPDEIVEHRPDRCGGCGKRLDRDALGRFTARQVIEIPEIGPTVTEHRAHACTCSCGHTTTAPFPDGVRPRSPTGLGLGP